MPRRAGQLVSHGDGKWLVRVFRGRDAGGRRRYHSRVIHGTKKDAQRYLTKAMRELDLGEFIEPSDKALSAYLAEWLASSVRARVAAKTAADYADLARLYLIPALGDRKLSQLTGPEIQRTYNGLLERGLSPRTIRYAHAVLHSALDQAVKWGLLLRNPANLIDLPRQARREMRTLSGEQAGGFLAAARADRYAVLWELLLMTGMRPGEALALTWADLDGGKVRVQRNLVRHADGRWELKEPKTARACRTVTLPRSTAQALQQHRRAQLEERLKAGPAYEDRGLVFAAGNGNPLDWRVIVQRHFNKVIKQAGLPRIRPYDLRHTSASLLLAAGENVKVVSERLGHASAALTLDVYSHVLPDMQQGAADRMQDICGG